MTVSSVCEAAASRVPACCERRDPYTPGMPPSASPTDWVRRVVVLTTLGVPVRLRLSAPTAAQADELAQAVRRAWAWTLTDALTDALTEPPVDAPAGDPADLDVPLLDDVETTLHHL